MMFNVLEPNHTMVGKWGAQLKMFNRMNFLIEGMEGKCQPVASEDVALAVLNALKLEESIGQTYDLGGPHVYTYEEMYEMFFNYSMVKPYTTLVKMEHALEYYDLRWYNSVWRKLIGYWLLPEFMTQEATDMLCDPKNKSFADLAIKPVSFGHRCHEYVQEIYWLHNTHIMTKRELMNV